MSQKRVFETTLEKRLLEKAPLIQVIVGPRQVGKTTAIKSQIQNRGIYFSADSPTPLPATIISDLWQEAALSSSKTLAIDEIQKIPGWSEVVKKLWDESDKKIKVILSGSAALTIEKNLKETLSGRFELIRASHWSFDEFHKLTRKSLRDFIEFGCYPGAVRFLEDVERWGEYIRDSIIEPAIGRDILQLHPINNPALFRQTFYLATQIPAQVISLNKLQGQLQDQGAIATIQHYLQLFHSAFLMSGVQKFSASGFRQKLSSPKIIIHDNALLRAFERPINGPLNPEKLGHYFENSVGARFIEAGWQTHYWQERNAEVDFIVQGPSGEKWAVEVKSNHIEKKDLQSLFTFCQRHADYEPCLVSLVDQEVSGVRTLNAKTILSLQR